VTGPDEPEKGARPKRVRVSTWVVVGIFLAALGTYIVVRPPYVVVYVGTKGEIVSPPTTTAPVATTTTTTSPAQTTTTTTTGTSTTPRSTTTTIPTSPSPTTSTTTAPASTTTTTAP
jgi:cytoskeletal protein RodZ